MRYLQRGEVYEETMASLIGQDKFGEAASLAKSQGDHDRAIELFKEGDAYAGYVLLKRIHGIDREMVLNYFDDVTRGGTVHYRHPNRFPDWFWVRIMKDLGMRNKLEQYFNTSIEHQEFHVARHIAIVLDRIDLLLDLARHYLDIPLAQTLIREARSKGEMNAVASYYHELASNPETYPFPKAKTSGYGWDPITERSIVLAMMGRALEDHAPAKTILREAINLEVTKGHVWNAARVAREGGFNREAIQYLLEDAQEGKWNTKFSIMWAAGLARKCGNFDLAIELLKDIDPVRCERLRKKQAWLRSKRKGRKSDK